MKKIVLTLIAALVILGASEAQAQDPVPASASITIPTLLSIDVTNTTVTFPTPDLADFGPNGIGMSSEASVVSTRGNVEHRVLIAADAATMSGPAGTAKPAADLEWGLDGSGTFTGLATGGATVVDNLARGSHPLAATVGYRMLLDEANDEPGTYSLTFAYTVVAN